MFMLPKQLTNRIGLLLFLVLATEMRASDPNPLPPFPAVRHTVQAYFAAQKERQPRDLMTRSEATEVLRAVNKLGWDITDQKEILEATLPDNHIMVTTFRTPAGQRFMRQISNRDLMYDRLDRISEVSGGPQLIRDIVKLPDGERYAKPRSGGGVPDLLDLLPKDASAQTRRIRDYHKPTGHIYTVDDLLARLEESHGEAVAAAAAAAGKAEKKP
jgi:hypothetical protein